MRVTPKTKLLRVELVRDCFLSCELRLKWFAFGLRAYNRSAREGGVGEERRVEMVEGEIIGAGFHGFHGFWCHSS